MYVLTWVGVISLLIGIIISELRVTRMRKNGELEDDWTNYRDDEELKRVGVFICGVICIFCYGGGHIPESTRLDSLPMSLWALIGCLYILYEMIRQVYPGWSRALGSKLMPSKKGNEADMMGLKVGDFKPPARVHDLELLIGIVLFVSVTEALMLCRDHPVDIEGAGATPSGTYHWAMWGVFIAQKLLQVWVLLIVSSFYFEPWRNGELITASHFYLVMAFYNLCCWVSSLAFAFRGMRDTTEFVTGDTGTKIVAVIYVALIIKFRMLSAIIFWQQYQRQPNPSLKNGEYEALVGPNDIEKKNDKDKTSKTYGGVSSSSVGEDFKEVNYTESIEKKLYGGIISHYRRALGYSIGSLIGMAVVLVLFVLSLLFFIYNKINSSWYIVPISINISLLLLTIGLFIGYGRALRRGSAWNERLALCIVGILASIGYAMAGTSVLFSHEHLSQPGECFTDEMLAEHGIRREKLSNRLWWNSLNLIFRGLSLICISILYWSFQPDNFWWRITHRQHQSNYVSWALFWTAVVLPYMLWGTLGLLIEEGIEQEATIVMKAASCTIDFWEGLWEAVAPIALGFRFLLLSHFLGMTRCFQEKWCGVHPGFHHEPTQSDKKTR